MIKKAICAGLHRVCGSRSHWLTAESLRDSGPILLCMDERGLETETDEPGDAGFPRGMANTIMIVEADEPVPWTKPDELEYARDKPLPNLGLTRTDLLVALFDGSVRSFDKPLDEAEIRKLITLRDE